MKNKLRESEGVSKKKRGRPKKMLSIMTIINTFLFFLMISSSYGVNSVRPVGKENYLPKFCTRDERISILDVEGICNFKKEEKIDFPELVNTTDGIIVLNKLFHEVSGKGYKCQIERIDMNCSRSFFRVDTCIKSEWRVVKLEASDCWNMVRTHQCKIEGVDFTYDKKMNCDAHGCSLEDYPNEKYNWMDTNYIHGYKCSFYTVSILAENKTSEIFYENNCKADEFKCQVDKSILVWNTSVVHSCPYEMVDVSRNFTNNGLLLVNYESNIILQPVKKIINCGMNMYLTNEGFYVTLHTNKALLELNKIQVGINKDVTDKLLLANIDFNEMDALKWFDFIDIQVCTIYSMILQVYSHLEGEYLKVTNNKGNSAILYTENGIIYTPECIEIRKADFPIETKRCYTELPITFTLNGNSKTGFINNDRIITLIGHEVDCKINSDIIFFSLNSFQRIGNKIIKKSLQQYNMIAANLIKGDTRRINTHHPEPILTSYDELKAISELIVHNEGSKTFYVEPLPDDLSLGTAEKWINGIKNYFYNIFSFFGNYIYLILLIIFIIILTLIILYLCFRTRCFGIGRVMKRQVRNLIIEKNFRPREDTIELESLIRNDSNTRYRNSEDRLKRLL